MLRSKCHPYAGVSLSSFRNCHVSHPKSSSCHFLQTAGEEYFCKPPPCSITLLSLSAPMKRDDQPAVIKCTQTNTPSLNGSSQSTITITTFCSVEGEGMQIRRVNGRVLCCVPTCYPATYDALCPFVPPCRHASLSLPPLLFCLGGTHQTYVPHQASRLSE